MNYKILNLIQFHKIILSGLIKKIDSFKNFVDLKFFDEN